MLGRPNRLSRSRDIGRVQRYGRYASSRHLSVRAAVSERQTTRATFVVSRRLDHRSVVRNKIKRRLRAAYRLIQKKIPSGFDVVVSARPSLKDVNFQTTLTDLDFLLRQLRILK